MRVSHDLSVVWAIICPVLQLFLQQPRLAVVQRIEQVPPKR